MGWHGGLLSALVVASTFQGAAREGYSRTETSKKRKQHTELRRQRKQERQARKRSRGQ